MGFEINGMPILHNNFGLVNYTNTFKTLLGNNIIGSGNIVDNGADALLYNTVGSYTIGGTSGTYSQRGTVAANAIYHYYNSAYGGFCYAVKSSASTSYHSNSVHGLSGTWAHKCLYSAATSGNYFYSLWQRIS